MADILIKTDEYVFSYRIAGVCRRNGCVLLQKPTNDDGYAFPGGHAEYGETNEQTLIREFREEIGADIEVGRLRWVGELLFPWGSRTCHQICLYYDITIKSGDIPMQGSFEAQESLEGRDFKLIFYWVPIDKLRDILLYPTNCTELLIKDESDVQHFVYRE